MVAEGWAATYNVRGRAISAKSDFEGVATVGIHRTALLLIVVGFLLSSSAEAAPRWFPLDEYRVDVFKGPITLRRYLRVRPNAEYATSTVYSNRRGAPAGLFAIAGRVYKGRTQTRCVFQSDATGQNISIGYEVRRPIHHAFEAGPCLMGWENGSRQAVKAALSRERIPRSFADSVTERSVLCLDKTGHRLIPFRMRASLWTVAEIAMRNGADRCINLDGGSQLSQDAINPAILGLLPNGE